ncbi:MAG: hypothetical protein M3151_11220 [Actinomycetota bacterium]|nr:hypothetical protein [Actinomycetota bacterium]
MYWYNPTIHASERVDAPLGDEEAISMLAGHPHCAALVSEYARLRRSNAPIERALVTVGHEQRLREHECKPMRLAAHDRPSSSSRGSGPRGGEYELLLAVRLRE